MPSFKCPDFVKETSSSTGNGDIVLSGPVSSWRSFSSQLSDQDCFPYSIFDTLGNDEDGFGIYHSANNSFSRIVVSNSTNNNLPVSFPVGPKIVTSGPQGGWTSQNPYQFANLAALRLNTLTWNFVQVNTYSTQTDPTAGMFVYVSSDNVSSDNGRTIIVDASGHRYYRITGRNIYSATVPTTGSWVAGDQVLNSNPGNGNNVGWVCTVSGNTGTFVFQPYGNIIQPSVASVYNITGVSNTTLTANNVVPIGGRGKSFIERSGPTGAFTDTFDTANNIIAAITGAVNNSSFSIFVNNNTNYLQTLAAGTGVTLTGATDSGNVFTVGGTSSRTFDVVVTNSATKTVTIYG